VQAQHSRCARLFPRTAAGTQHAACDHNPQIEEPEMESNGPLLPPQQRVPLIDAEQQVEVQPVATRDPEVIKRWAARRQARPATGEQSASGPRTQPGVHDGGAGIRFNFPGVSPFREITWDEWLEHFQQHSLTFFYEETTPDGRLSHRYRLVRADEASDRIR
jgi:hypothetical protein